MTSLDTYTRDVLAVFQGRPQRDFLASEIAPVVGGDVGRACATMQELMRYGYLVTATITRKDGTTDVQGRLSLVQPLDAARETALTAISAVGSTVDARLALVSDQEAAAPTAPRRDPAAAAARRAVPRTSASLRIETRSPEPGGAPGRSIRFGLFNDGSMQLERGTEVFTLDTSETRALFTFLDRFSGLAAEGAS